MTLIRPALLAAILAAGPAAAQSDAETAAAVREAAASVRQAIERLEQAAAALDRLAAADGGEAAAVTEASGGEDAQAPGEEIVFLHALDNKPIEFDLRSDQEITPAVEQFHRTAENPYSGDEEAIAAGKKLYGKLCKACHLEDGSGRIGPNIVDDTWKYERTDTDKGMFEIIYAGGAGAMQAFGKRIDQDEILKVMAYLEVLGEE